MKIIDTHQHFWKYDVQKHSWIDDEMAVIRKDFSPETLADVYQKIGIMGSIAVQADQSNEETEMLLELASKNNFIKGVIGWIDLKSDQLASQLDIWKDKKILKGFRHVLQIEVPEFMLDEKFIRGIEEISKRGYIYEILIFPQHLEATISLVQKLPNTTFVLDHIAKPNIKNREIKEWAEKIYMLASFNNVNCKVSGMVTEADYKNWSYQDILPYLEVILDAFGSDRLVYGSDWPVCLVAGTYQEVLEIPRMFFGKLSPDEQASIFYENALRIYNL